MAADRERFAGQQGRPKQRFGAGHEQKQQRRFHIECARIGRHTVQPLPAHHQIKGFIGAGIVNERGAHQDREDCQAGERRRGPAWIAGEGG